VLSNVVHIAACPKKPNEIEMSRGRTRYHRLQRVGILIKQHEGPSFEGGHISISQGDRLLLLLAGLAGLSRDCWPAFTAHRQQENMGAAMHG